jgi:hypothetical protein
MSSLRARIDPRNVAAGIAARHSPDDRLHYRLSLHACLSAKSQNVVQRDFSAEGAKMPVADPTKPWCRSQSPKSSEPVSFAFRKPDQRSQPDRLGKLTHGQALHHARPVNFDGTLVDPTVVCDDLVWMSLRQRIQNLSRGRMIRNRALVVLGRSGISNGSVQHGPEVNQGPISSSLK